MVFESTPAGRAPLVGARLEVLVCSRGGGPTYESTISSTVTGPNGYFEIPQVCSGVAYIWAEKEGYRTHPPTPCDGDCLPVSIGGDTNFDVELFRE
jgi:hypothetical protein